ncbi:MAG: cytochrome c biogenesis protein CcsA [Pseudomonadota bacterium]
MSATGVLFGLLAALSYGFAAYRFAGALRADRPTRTLPCLAPLAAGLLAHAVSLSLGDAFDFGLTNALSLTAWLMVATVFGLAFSLPVASLVCIMAPIAAVIAVASPLVNPGGGNAVDPGVWTHAVSSLVAYGLLGLAAVQACIVAWQTRQLRSAPGAGSGSLPPLAALERLMFWLISAGLLLLSVAIASGFAFLEDMLAQRVAHKTVFSLLAWVAFAGLLLGHHLLGWRGKTALRWTLAGMGSLLVGFFGSKLVLEVILQPG